MEHEHQLVTQYLAALGGRVDRALRGQPPLLAAEAVEEVISELNGTITRMRARVVALDELARSTLGMTEFDYARRKVERDTPPYWREVPST
jgi:hypothetical protein